MEIINNIKQLFYEKNDKYYIKIGNFKSDSKNIKLFETDKLKLEISDELTSIEAALVLENILINENDFKLNSIIMNDLYLTFVKHITDMKIMNNKCYNINYLIHNNYLWIIGFIDQIIFKLKTVKTIKIINITSMVLVNNLYLNNQIISKKIEKFNSNVYEKLSLNILWYNQPEYIIFIDTSTSSIDLATLKSDLIKFKSHYYDINSICYTISKVLKVITVDEYKLINKTSHNNNIPIELNNRITPFIKNNGIKIPFKFAEDCIQLSFYQLFRCVGINLNKTEFVLLINFLLYSNYPLNDTIKYNWSKLLKNNTYIQTISNMNIFNNTGMNKLYFNYIKILFHQNKEISQYIYKHYYDDMITKIQIVNSEDTLQILLHIFINWFINDEKAKKFQTIPTLDIFANKVEKYIEVFNFNKNLKVDIINFLWKNRNNLLNTNLNINNPITKSYLNEFLILYKNKNNYSSNPSNTEELFTVFNPDKNNKLNQSVYDIINKILFGNLLNKCNLCDEHYYCDSSSVYYMKCNKHQVCLKCANRLYFKNNYKQGDYIDECHFVCSFCRQYEHNNIFVLPVELYNNIKENDLTTLKDYRLCSYAGCNMITKTDVPRLCNANTQDDNNRENGVLTPIYCNTHLTIMRIMTQLQIDKNKNNVEYKNCLQCGIAINKLDGCNHMKCVCGFEFCWVCDYKKPEDAELVYKHPSYCRGNYSWEEGLISLDKLLIEFNKDMVLIGLNSFDLHSVYSKWLNEILASYPIYSVSFWDLDLWIRKNINRENANDTEIPNNLHNIGYNISITIGNIFEWINNPYMHDIKNVIAYLIKLLTDLKIQHPQLFVIPDKIEILQYD
jgi:hypothetical protein